MQQLPNESNKDFMVRLLMDRMEKVDDRFSRELVPAEYKSSQFGQTKGALHQNVHEIKLEANFTTWNNGAWHILKPHFFTGIYERRWWLPAIIQNLLHLEAAPHISDELLEQTLIKNTQNNRIFESFVMIKILKESLFVLNRKLFHGGTYESGRAVQYKSSFEENLMGQLGLIIDNESELSEDGPIARTLDTLKNIIADIAVHSSFEAIALEVGRSSIEPMYAQLANSDHGLCDIRRIHLHEMINICTKKSVKKVADWLTKQTESPLTQTLSTLLNAVLEEPVNIAKFLETLNLKMSSANDELQKIYSRKKEVVHHHQYFQDQMPILQNKLFVALRSLNSNTSDAALKAYNALNELGVLFLADLGIYSQRTEVKKAIDQFREQCAKYFNETDKIMTQDGWLFNIIEETVTEVIALYEAIGMEPIDKQAQDYAKIRRILDQKDDEQQTLIDENLRAEQATELEKQLITKRVDSALGELLRKIETLPVARKTSAMNLYTDLKSCSTTLYGQEGPITQDMKEKFKQSCAQYISQFLNNGLYQEPDFTEYLLTLIKKLANAVAPYITLNQKQTFFTIPESMPDAVQSFKQKVEIPINKK